MKRRRASGFTIRKLLVGIAIIALLIGILTILFVCTGPVGYSSEVDKARVELGIKEGPRPVPEVQIDPPGPPDRALVTEQEIPGTGDAGDQDQGQDEDQN